MKRRLLANSVRVALVLAAAAYVVTRPAATSAQACGSPKPHSAKRGVSHMG